MVGFLTLTYKKYVNSEQCEQDQTYRKETPESHNRNKTENTENRNTTDSCSKKTNFMTEKKTSLPSLRKQDWKNDKRETEKVNNFFTRHSNVQHHLRKRDNS